MKVSCLRWLLTVLMLLCLAMAVSSPAMAESSEGPSPLPMDFAQGGRPLRPENWVYGGNRQVLMVELRSTSQPPSPTSRRA